MNSIAHDIIEGYREKLISEEQAKGWLDQAMTVSLRRAAADADYMEKEALNR